MARTPLEQQTGRISERQAISLAFTFRAMRRLLRIRVRMENGSTGTATHDPSRRSGLRSAIRQLVHPNTQGIDF